MLQSKGRYILALDQGTTSSRAILFDRGGEVVSEAQREFRQDYPQGGWVEHDATEIWSSQSTALVEALSKANLSGRDVAGVGITNQRETVLVWNRETGEPVSPAIVWQDRRTADICGKLKAAGHEGMVREKTGLFIDPYFSATKVQWILENVEGARRQAEAGDLILGTMDTWLIWKFTNGAVHVTDVSNASRTLLYNIHEEDWDADLLKFFGIPRTMLPEVKSSSAVYGEIHGDYASGGIPIAGIAGDQQAALFGQACHEPGMAKNTYGTGCFLLMNTGEEAIPSKNNLVTTIAWRIGEKTEYALEGSVFIAGAVVQWLRDELQLVDSARECDELAESVEDTNGLYLVPAFTGLGAPYWDPYARGAAFGMTRGTNRAHFCRAALEAIAFQCADLIRAMEKDAGMEMEELRVDGGAARSRPLLQFQADLLQQEVIRPETIETTALGAAYLAGLGVGFYESKEQIQSYWKEDARFQPKREAEEMAAAREGWDRAVEQTRGFKL